jgi:lipoate-protein ligase A
MGRSGIGVAGRKVSGNAFCYRGSRVLHHGTLLVSADLAKLQQALTPPPIKIRTRAVPSERSPVMNLAELVPNLTVERVAGTLAEGLEPASADFVELASLMELEKKHGSPAWLYEATPPFEAKFLSWRVRVDKGRIASGNLAGCPFRSRDMSARLEGDSKERVLALGL